MNICFAARGILQIDEARITHRNFSGRGDKYNREGDRNFSVIISDEEIKDALVEEGWNVKIRPPRDEDESPFMYLKVKIKFNDRGPNVYLASGKSMRRLNEDTIGILDNVDIDYVDMDIRPYDWDVSGKQGRTAYLHSIKVVQRISDRFAENHNDDEY